MVLNVGMTVNNSDDDDDGDDDDDINDHGCRSLVVKINAHDK